MLDRFPPIPFSRYELVYMAGGLDKLKEKDFPKYYVTNALWLGNMDPELKRRYELSKNFDRFEWRGHFFRDRFTAANFPVAVLIKKS
jgi:hypothetical protein